MSSHEDPYEELVEENTSPRGGEEEEVSEERSSLEVVRENLAIVVRDVEFFINEDEEFEHYEQDDRLDMIDAYAHLLKARDLL